MKKLNILLLAGCTALTFAGCQSGKKDSTAKADSANATTDSTEKTHPNTNIATSGDDDKFAVDAANGGMAEVVLGELAQQKTKNDDVRNFAQMMVMDHSKANEELKKIAADKKITLPDSINNEESKLKAELAAESGTDFDKAYVNAMVDDHKKDIKDFQEAANKVKYPAMQAFIKNTLPVLQKHLDAIEKIQGKMK